MLTTFYQMFMNLLTMLTGSSVPITNRSFIQTKGFDDRLDWSSVRQQGDHLNHQFRCMTQTIENRAPRRGKRLLTNLTDTPLLFQTVRMDVAFAYLSSCRAIHIRAK
jgi:hypothetical protein